MQILWKSLKGYALWGVYIPHFDQISVKVSVFFSCTDGVKFGVEEGTFAKFHPHRCNVSLLRGEKEKP